MNEKYIRNIPSIDEASQNKLWQSRVLVIGCGGLGGYIIEELARLGVGNISVADGDVFVESNTNRQLLCTAETLGQSKADVAAKRISSINSDISVTSYNSFMNASKLKAVISDIDLVFDALDNVADRLVLEDICSKAGIPLIHGAVRGWNLQVAVSMPGSKFLHGIYGSVDNQDQSTDTDDPVAKTVLCPVPATCASIQVAQALLILTGKQSALENHLLLMDLEAPEINIL